MPSAMTNTIFNVVNIILILFLIHQKSLEEINEHCGYLSCEESIGFFINLVNDNQFKYKMYNPLDFIHSRPRYTGNGDDVQILFVENDKNGDVGHFICTFFNYNSKIVDVYDSDFSESVIKKIKPILIGFYGKNMEINIKYPKSTQNDNFSCGVYAIIYSLLLIQDKDPEQCELFYQPNHSDETLILRQFISKMFETYELLEFDLYIGFN